MLLMSSRLNNKDQMFMVDSNFDIFRFTGCCSFSDISIDISEVVQGGAGIEFHPKTLYGYYSNDRLIFDNEQDAWDLVKFARAGNNVCIIW